MKYKKVAELPKPVRSLIEIANLFPWGIECPSFLNALARANGAATQENMDNRELIDIWIGGLPDKLRRKFTEIRNQSALSLETAFNEFQFIKNLLNEVVAYSERFRQDEEHARPTFPGMPIPGGPQLRVDEFGLIDFSIYRHVRALQGCELRRFRRCKVCGDVFWARRSGAGTCSPTCSKVLWKEKRREAQDAMREERERARKRDFRKK